MCVFLCILLLSTSLSYHDKSKYTASICQKRHDNHVFHICMKWYFKTYHIPKLKYFLFKGDTAVEHNEEKGARCKLMKQIANKVNFNPLKAQH